MAQRILEKALRIVFKTRMRTSAIDFGDLLLLRPNKNTARCLVIHCAVCWVAVVPGIWGSGVDDIETWR